MTVESAAGSPRRRGFAVAAGVGVLILGIALALLLFLGGGSTRPAEFVALDPISGEPVWELTVETLRAPAVAGDRVVLVADDRIWAVNERGEVDWETMIERASTVDAAGPSVYVGTRDSDGASQVAVLDPATGVERWRADGFLSDASGEFAVLRQDGRYTVLDASSGSLLGEFSVGRGGNYSVGASGVAYVKKSGKLKLIDGSGNLTVIATELPARTKIDIVTSDAVILHSHRSSRTKVLSGYDISTGDELWTAPITGFGGAEIRGGAITARINAVNVDLDPRTGSLTPNGGWATISDQNGLPIASVAQVRAEPISDEAVRYLRLAGQVIAIDRRSNEVLWSRPSTANFAAADGIALFRDGKAYSVVNALTGSTVAEIDRVLNTTGVVGGGRALIAAGGEVVAYDASGSPTRLATLLKRVRAEAVNAEYAVVVDRGNRDNSTRVYAFAVEDQSSVLDRTFDGPRRVTLDGDTLVVGGSRERTAINLRTGEENRSYEFGTRDELPFSTYQLAAMDPDRSRLLWIREIDSRTTFQQVGGSILVSSIPSMDY